MNVSGFEITAVLFDLDNTLVDRDEAIRKLGQSLYALVKSSNKLLDQERFVDEFIRIDAGGSIPDKRDQMTTVAQELAIVGLDVDELHSWWNRMYPQVLSLESSTLEVLNLLTNVGLPWGIVTNGSPLQMSVIAAVELGSIATSVTVSSLVGLRKPDPAIFELAMSQTAANTPAEDFLFVGDNPTADIIGAAQIGMKTAWVSRGAKWPITDIGANIGPDITIDSVGKLLGLTTT
ncbi:MAG: HAD family hydrolase [Chloroflexi bacterium]|nr:HAD family hydrolase [Chloroflexota bacterium]